MAKKKKQAVSHLENKRIIGKFVVTYVVLMGLFIVLIGAESIKKVIDIDGFYSNMIVNLTAFMLSPFHFVQSVSGSIIQLKRGVALDVKFGCNGLEAFLIYAIAIVSFPADKWHKFIGIVAGFIVMQGLNVLRIAGLAFCSVYFNHLFHYMHIYVAQGMMIAIAVLLFLIWLNYATKPQNII